MGADRCPLCAAPNACAPAHGAPDGPCWCFGRRLDGARLQQHLGDANASAACLCARCADDFATIPERTPDP